MSMAYTVYGEYSSPSDCGEKGRKITSRHHRGYQQLSYLVDIDFDLRIRDSSIIERTYLLSDD